MVALSDIGAWFGPGWVASNVIPKLKSYTNEENYLYRLTPLIALRYLEPNITGTIFGTEIYPLLNTLATDKIPNVRMNVAQITTQFAPKIKGSDAGEKAADLLKALRSDADFDVSHFASQGLKEF